MDLYAEADAIWLMASALLAQSLIAPWKRISLTGWCQGFAIVPLVNLRGVLPKTELRIIENFLLIVRSVADNYLTNKVFVKLFMLGRSTSYNPIV